MLLQAPPAIVEQCPAASARLFDSLRRLAIEKPIVALACVPFLRAGAQREQIYREAFNAAMASDAAAASSHVKQFLDRPWLCDSGFFPALRASLALASSDAGTARALLIAAARRHPGVALREAAGFLALPFGAEALEDAMESAPDETVGLASGSSRTAQIIRSAMDRSTRPGVRVLAQLTGSDQVAVRERAAVFFRAIGTGSMTVARALEIGAGDRYFSEVAALRPDASDAPMLERVLERSAQVLFRSMEGGSLPSEVVRLSARDAYLLLTYGRTEADAKLFARVFDGVLVPKLRSERRSVISLIDSAGDAHIRRFLTSAASNGRLQAFLRLAGSDAEQVLARCFRRLDAAARPIDEALAANSVLEALGRPEGFPIVGETLAAERARAERERSIEGPAIYHLLERTASGWPGRERHRTLSASALFDANGVFVQQHFFYDDDDGVESFASFRDAYKGQPKWRWEEHGDYVRLTGSGRVGRRIEIFANIPDLKKFAAPRDNDSRHALSRHLAERGLTPAMFVHRGHSYFVEQTVRYLGQSAQLVYLGSCRGLENISAVMSVASRAQIIVSRATGTMEVNDPLLKAINDELLAGAASIDWERFWSVQARRLGAKAHFSDYLPPHRNGPAMFLAAYWDYLGSL